MESRLGSYSARALACLAGESSLFAGSAAEKLGRLQGELRPLAGRYDVVVANPPYMGSNNMNAWLNKWTKKRYAETCKDLCTCFIKRGMSLAATCGYEALITSDTCMYISSFEKMRKTVIDETSIVAFIDTRGTNAHPDVFDANAGWVLWLGRHDGLEGSYFKLNHPIADKESRYLEALADPDCGWFYRRSSSVFEKTPGNVIGYWLSNKVLSAYSTGIPLGEIAAPRKGNSTSNNNRFLRLWYEVSRSNVRLRASAINAEETRRIRWYPYNKGGDYRRWYGNNEYVIDWYDNGASIRAIPTAVVTNEQYYMKPGLTWSTVSSARFNIRKFGRGFIFDNGGCCVFDLGDRDNYLLGLMNSAVFTILCGSINPTLNFQSGDVAKFPVIDDCRDDIAQIVCTNLEHSIDDWNAAETSWDFKRHPLL